MTTVDLSGYSREAVDRVLGPVGVKHGAVASSVGAGWYGIAALIFFVYFVPGRMMAVSRTLFVTGPYVDIVGCALIVLVLVISVTLLVRLERYQAGRAKQEFEQFPVELRQFASRALSETCASPSAVLRTSKGARVFFRPFGDIAIVSLPLMAVERKHVRVESTSSSPYVYFSLPERRIDVFYQAIESDSADAIRAWLNEPLSA